MLCAFLFSLHSYSQTNYTVNYLTNVGNPGGLNTGTDADIAGWSTLVQASLATNTWSADSLLPFAFNFYGNPVTSFRASANGLITFSKQTALPGENANLPSNLLPDSTIACFWDAFTNTPPTGSNDYVVWRVFGTAPNRQVWIKWVSFEIGAPSIATVNFGCVLEETTNNIYMVEGELSVVLSTPATSVTAGLQLNATRANQYDTKYLQRPNNGAAASDNNYVVFSPYQLSNMVVQGASVVHPNLNIVSKNSNDNEMLRVKVSVNGELSPLALSQLSFNTTGTSNTGDIANAKVFYTGADSVFNNLQQFGSAVSNPSGSFNISGTQQLLKGDNYFWLTYSTGAFAAASNLLDAEFNQAIINSVPVTPPNGAPVGSRTIGNGLSGIIPVGSGGSYNLLSEAFLAINNEGVSGDLTLSIVSDIADTGTAVITYNNPSNYKIVIAPSSGTLRTISSRLLNTYIDINGAKNITFNGNDPSTGTGKFLRFINKSDSGATIRFRNGARLDTIMNCIVEGAVRLQTMGVIHIASSANSLTNRDIVISRNDIRDRSDSVSIPAILIYSKGSYTSRNGFITISNNNLFNYMRSGVFVDYSGNTGNWKVNGNSFYYNSVTSQPAAGDLVSLMLSPGMLANNNQVHNNYFGGSAPLCAGTPWVNSVGVNFVVMNINAGVDAGTSIQGNTIQNISLTSNVNVAFVGIRLESGKMDVGNIEGNVVGHPSTAASINSNLYLTFGIYGFVQGNGDLLIGNNIVANITSPSANASSSVRGICIQGGAVSPVIYNNQVYNLSSASTATGTTTTAISGISIVSGTNLGQISIRGNKVYNIASTATTGNVYPSAIIVDHLSANGIVENNVVYGITGVSTGTTASIHGLYIVGPVSNWLVRNNMISLSNSNNTNPITIRGISDNASGNSVNYYHNSVYIGGEATSGAINSFAFERRNASSVPVLRNNILYNERKGGTGIHAAIANIAAATNWTANTSGYNLLVSASPATIGAWLATPTAQSFDQWQTVTGGDKTSWSDTAAAVPADSLFLNKATGDLSIDSSRAHSWYVSGKGIPLAGSNPDKDGQPRSNTIASGATNIGADQFFRSPVPQYPFPPVARVKGNIAIGDSSVYTFAGRNVATVYWTSGILPTTADCRYYTGVFPTTGAGQSGRLFNSFTEINTTGPASFVADVKQYYDSALFGTVSNSANIIAATTTGWFWNPHNAVVNTAERSFRSNGLSSLDFHYFTGTDGTNPVPVKLTTFNGANSNGDAILYWNTASEKGTDRFEVEVSVNEKEFVAAGTVMAVGNSSNVVKYSFVDDAAFAENNVSKLYYRLKIVDKDGSFEYSKTIALENGQAHVVKAEVYPNPFSGNTRIYVTSSKETKAHITVTSIHGEVIADEMHDINTGSNSFIPAAFESAKQGVYLISLEIDGVKQNFKLVK